MHEVVDNREIRKCLVLARSFIESEENWIQGVMARDDADVEVDPEDETACRWCVIGAVEKSVIECFGTNGAEILSGTLSLLTDTMQQRDESRSNHHLAWWNDHGNTTHADVLQIFDAAITATSKEVEQ